MVSVNPLPPHILAEWHPELNSSLDVSSITAGSHTKVWWLGKDCGHAWEASVQSRALKNQGCSVCAGKTILPGFNDLATKCPIIAAEWHPTKNNDLLPTNISRGSSKKVWWQCQKDHEWEAAVGNRTSKNQKCPMCSGKKVIVGSKDLQTMHPDIAVEWHPTKNGDLLPTQILPNARKKVWWLGKDCGHAWEAMLGNRVTNQTGCPVCVGRQVLPNFNDLSTTHPDVAAEWHPILNTISVSTVTHGSHEKVWWLGKDCGHEWEAEIHSRTGVNLQGCPYCSNNKVLTGFNDLVTTHPLTANEWHPTKNNELNAEDVSHGSSHNAWWFSSLCNHEWQTPIYLRAMHNQDCPYCAGKRILIGYNDLPTTHPNLIKEWHPTKNGDLLPIHVSFGSHKKVWWLSEHCTHEWEMHIYSRTGSQTQGCPYCGNVKVLTGFNDLLTVNPLIASEWHPHRNYSLLPTSVSGVSGQKVWWVGKKCGHEWESTIANRVNGSGCPVCIGQKVLIGFNDLTSQKPIIAAQWHPTKNAPLLPEQFTIGSDKKVWWLCNKEHEWESDIYNRTARGGGCPTCYATTFVSKAEHSIAEFIRELGLSVIQSDRKILKGKELDILVSDKNIAIEYNGVFWHTEKGGKDKEYHRNKWLAAKQAGIQLVQIWEDEWNRNPEQIKRMIAHKLGVTNERKVFARKTIVSPVTKAVAEQFLNEHHVQGYAAGSYYYGLFDKHDPKVLVALLVLRKEKGNGLNIIRYATSANVIGGFTKLLTYAERILSPDFIITFSDHCVSDGGLYENNGFTADKELKPDYRYVIGAERKHKFGYRLKRFKDDPALIWIDGLKERELADLNGIDRIWDAGKTRWIKKFV